MLRHSYLIIEMHSNANCEWMTVRLRVHTHLSQFPVNLKPNGKPPITNIRQHFPPNVWLYYRFELIIQINGYCLTTACVSISISVRCIHIYDGSIYLPIHIYNQSLVFSFVGQMEGKICSNICNLFKFKLYFNFTFVFNQTTATTTMLMMTMTFTHI